MIFRPRTMLRPYQERVAGLITRSPSLLLNIPMGLGKTAIVLTAISDILRARPQYRVLIVAPLRVANNVWPDEIYEWEHTVGTTFSIVTGSPRKRKEAIKHGKSIYIVNFENLRWVLEQGIGQFDMVVIDESSRLRSGKKKTPKTNNLTTFGAAADICLRTPKRILLTGTMAPNGIHGLWGQAYCLDGGRRLGATRSAFERRWFKTDYMGWNMEPMPHAEEEVTKLLSDVVVTLTNNDVVTLPEVVNTNIHISLPPKVRLEYRELQRTLVSQQFSASAASRGVLQNKLMQICNGSIYDDDQKPIIVHEQKLNALEQLVEEVEEENLLVFYQYRFDLTQIRRKFLFSQTLTDSEKTIKDWNSGRVKMLVAHPASCAHGLNLQFGGCRVVWYGLTWNLELYQQANARVRRPGQTSDKCYQHHIVARNTVEERVLLRLNEKGATQERINDAFIEC